MKISIAIDGYSSCGKSTLAKALAKALHYTYIDSGAIYRGITYYFLQHNIDTDSTSEIVAALPKIALRFIDVASVKHLELNGVDIETAIRTMEVANKVSTVATIREVRQYAVALQKSMGAARGVVMDGRDVGTVILPDAELKLFMTADIEVRTQRRWKELLVKDPDITYEAVKENLQHRDWVDTTRALDPLIQAPDAKVLDNSTLNQEQQLDLVLDMVSDVIHQLTV